jgi:PhnB protein
MLPARSSFAISLDPDVAETESLFAALAQDGTITVPLQQTFWARAFAVVTDRFGIPRIINADEHSA